MAKQTPIVIGIAGGSGSGKTTVARVILDQVGSNRIAYLQHDAYYRDYKDLPYPQRIQVNFDHPNSLESELADRAYYPVKELAIGGDSDL